MKKSISILLLVCLCLALAGCGKSGAAQAASAPVIESSAAASADAPAPKPASTPKPINLKPVVANLNDIEMEQRKKEMPFVGIYEVTDDGSAVIYKMAIEHFEYIALGAEIGEQEYVDGYNQTIDELPAMVQAVEDLVQVSAPNTPAYIYLMLSKDLPVLLAIASSDQILYDAVNGVGEEPAGLTPIIEPEDAPAA